MKKNILLLLVIFFLVSCSLKERRHVYYPPTKVYEGYSEVGIASWYGGKFHGRPTASGEIYNMYAMTAAHKTLPLGTYVRVKNLENGKEAIVKINDRGPFVKGRIIDLSYKAAKKLGMAEKGIAKVKITVVKSPFEFRNSKFVYKKYYGVQVGSFKNYSNALNFKKYLKRFFDIVYIKAVNLDGEKFYRVIIGDFSNKEDTYSILSKLEKKGFDAFVIEIDK